MTDAIVTVKEIEEMEVGIEIIHDILIESEGRTIAGIIIDEAAKVHTMTGMQIGIVKQTVIAAGVTKTWTDHEGLAPDLDLQDEEVTDIFAFVSDVNDMSIVAL